MFATFDIDSDEPMGFYVGTVRGGFGDELEDADDDHPAFQDRYDAEVFVIDPDSDHVMLEIKQVASGESFYVNISDVIMLLNGERFNVVAGPKLK